MAEARGNWVLYLMYATDEGRKEFINLPVTPEMYREVIQELAACCGVVGRVTLCAQS